MSNPGETTDILYYIKEMTPYGDLYKIGVTWNNSDLSVRDNIIRRYTIFNSEMKKGLKFEVVDYWFGTRAQVERVEEKIKAKYYQMTYQGQRNIIPNRTEVFILDVLGLDIDSKLFDIIKYEKTIQLRSKEEKELHISTIIDLEMEYLLDKNHLSNLMAF